MTPTIAPLPLTEPPQEPLYIAYRRSGLRRIGLRYEDALRDPLYGTCLRCWATAIERARQAANRRSA